MSDVIYVPTCNRQASRCHIWTLLKNGQNFQVRRDDKKTLLKMVLLQILKIFVRRMISAFVLQYLQEYKYILSANGRIAYYEVNLK